MGLGREAFLILVVLRHLDNHLFLSEFVVFFFLCTLSSFFQFSFFLSLFSFFAFLIFFPFVLMFFFSL